MNKETLLQKSKEAEKIRENTQNKQEALEKSGAIWQEVLLEAKKAKDWERVVDVLGQLALNLKHANLPSLALIPTEECLQTVRKHMPKNKALEQVYLAEIANLMGNTGSKALLKQAETFALQAVKLARKHAVHDLCHTLTQSAKIFLLENKLEKAKKYIDEAYELATQSDNVRHPAHRAGAIVTAALYQKAVGNSEAAQKLLDEAKTLSEKHQLQRRLEQIQTLIQTLKKDK